MATKSPNYFSNITYGWAPNRWDVVNNGWQGAQATGGKLADPFNIFGFGGGAHIQDYAVPDVTRPGYEQAFNPISMSLTPELQKRLDAIQMDKSGLEKFRQEALRTGPSEWARLALGDQRFKESTAREKGAKEVENQQAQAGSDLAASGGLTSGARERLAREGIRNYLAMSQGLAHEGIGNAMQIGINDEQNRIQQLGMLPSMEYQAIQPDLQKASQWEQARQADLAATVEENNRRNQWNMNLYQEQMRDRAAAMQANATQNSGKK